MELPTPQREVHGFAGYNCAQTIVMILLREGFQMELQVFSLESGP